MAWGCMALLVTGVTSHSGPTAPRYETVAAHEDELKRPYTALAALLHCKPQNIALVGSATSAWAQVRLALHLAIYF